jgi:hypothetical protein
MLFDPAEAEAKIKAAELAKADAAAAAQKASTVVPQEHEPEHAMRHREFKPNQKLFERWMRFKQFVLLKSFRKKDDNNPDAPQRRRSLLGIFFW